MAGTVHHLKRHVPYEEYEATVTIVFSPESKADAPECTGEFLPGDATFRLLTTGMFHFGRPELSMTGVPALWLAAAGSFLNGWALYTINEREFKPGETLTGGLDSTVLLEVEQAPDGVLLLVPRAMRFQCAHCGGAP